MKLIRLELSAFGPFRAETVVDFTQFHGKIFLLTGETGAGKTSIFDAVSYALYGEASGGRERRSGKSFRSDYADADTPTYVKLAFLENGRHCTVTRSPEYERAKKRGKGTTTEPAVAVLEIEGEDRVITRIEEVDARIREIVGLDRRQFSRTVMIAQGDFLRILNAGSDERKTMFQRLFHTEIYAKAEEALRERSRLCRAKREELTLRARSAASRAACLPDFERALTFDRAKDGAGEHPEAFLTVLEEYDHILERSLAELKGTEQQYQKHIADLALAIQGGETHNSQLAERDALLKAVELSAAEADRRQQEREAIRAAQNALRIRPFELAMKARAAESAEAAQKLDEAKKSEKTHTVTAHFVAEHLKTLQKKAEALPAEDEEIRRMKLALLALSAHQKAVDQLEQATAALATERESCVSAEAAYARLRDLFWLGQAGLLAEGLLPGMPCPVCGSVEHPSKAHRPEETPTKEDLERARERQELAQERFHRATGGFERAREACRHTAQTLAECGVAESEKKELLEAAVHEREAAAKALRTAVAEALEHERAAAEGLTASRAVLSAAIERLSHAQAQELLAAQKFSQALQAGGFADEPTYRAAVCGENELEARERSLRELQEKSERTRGRLAQLEKSVGQRAAVDVGTLKDEKATHEKHLAALSETLRTCDRLLNGNESALCELKGLLSEKKKNEEEWKIVEDLYRTVGGMGSGGRAKLSLEGYVQRYYFREVVAAANRRLTVLTDGNFVLRCREVAKDLKSRADLDLEVLDRSTGAWRDVSTLSGGESFMASLALAVGLSDVVQNRASHVHLDMLFIDEGFGSLDEGTLQRAMELLNRLSDGNRTIGIISHVAELREHIDKKLIVTHTPRGSVLRVEA